MADKSKSTGHSKSNSPSSPSSISSTSQITKEEIDRNIQTPTTKVSNQSDNQPLEAPEIQYLVHKLQGFSLSLEESEISEGSVTSQFVSSRPLTRSQSEKLGIPPKEFPLPSRVKTRKTSSESGSDIISSSQTHSSASQTQTQKSIVIPTTSTQTPVVSSSPSIVIPTMAQRPWTNPGAIEMPAPLHDFPDHPKKWLPKFSPDLGIQAEEHINNFIIAVNFNAVEHEDGVVRLFPNTL